MSILRDCTLTDIALHLIPNRLKTHLTMGSLNKSLYLCGPIARVQRAPVHTTILSARSHRCHYLRLSAYRNLSSSSRLTYPRKDSQHKDSINTEATEYSKSATDDEGARQEEAAFDPNLTDPQEQKGKAGEATGVSPELD